MHDLAHYRNRHTDLLQMIEDLQQLLTPEMLRIRPNAKTAYLLLCELGSKVKEHLSEEDRGVYPSLLINDDPRVKSIAWGFISGERPLRQTFDEYHRKWLKNCDFNFTEDFLRESQGVFRMVAERIDRENRVLFPKLVEIGLFQETRA
ncbi:MAG: hemerythrin domain-containing protein [Chromatiaceae bacterium]|jgi:hemerythrin-like domain-containing protein|nr:hemerythrin domain-containing protein [Chromatiaceae bacterium]MBP8289665.1 hemerythrin domain-containing protein [Chromatiaceae bacterium]